MTRLAQMEVRVAARRLARLSVFLVGLVAASVQDAIGAQRTHQNSIIDLWTAGKATFGIYAPRPYTKETGEKLAASPLYDFVFLNLEGGYDPAAT